MRKLSKKVVALGLVVISALGLFVGCDLPESVSDKERGYTELNQEEIEKRIGKPNLSNFFEYAQLKEIYEMRDNPELVCHWYTKNEYSGKLIYMGKCIGYGIPYGASLTNPEEYYLSSTTIPMAEPNGLYTNNVTSSATWVLSSTAEGIKPVYVESEITVSQTKLDKRLCEDWSLPSDY